MNPLSVLAVTLMLTACTQASTPSTEAAPEIDKAQAAATQATSDATDETPTPATTPILSLLVGNRITPAAMGLWCMREGAAPFTKISIQDESIAAPIENQSAPLPGARVAKDTGTQQAPGTAHITSQSGDSTFKIQWLREGIRGDAQIVVQGDSLSFTDESGAANFVRCQ